MEDKITFEAMPQALSSLIAKVDKLQTSVEAIQKAGSRKEEEPMIGITEACKILGLAKSTVYAMTQQHRLPFYQPGKMLLFKRSELMAWMEQSRQQSAEETRDSIREQMQRGIRRKPKSQWS